MIIDSLRIDKASGLVRILANVAWENSPRAPLTIWIGVPEEFESSLSCNPDAFLTACLLPAMRHGETRIKLDGAVCARLRTNLDHVMRQMQVWYGDGLSCPRIECGVAEQTRYAPRRESACFMSGGVDSLAMLRENATMFDPQHPGRFRACILVGGMDFFRGESAILQAGFEKARRATERVAADCGASLIPAWTNLRELEPDGPFYLRQFHGAVMASIAHALGQGYANFSIASSQDLGHMEPWGTTPWLDSYFGSHQVCIHHEQAWMTRLDKVKLLAGWPVALNEVRVCTKTFHGQYNCGKCEKCMRTMAALEAVGMLDAAASFTTKHIDTAVLRRASLHGEYGAACYRELLPLLRERGRTDLVNAINALLRRYYWRAPLRALDQRYLGGALTRLVARRRHGAHWQIAAVARAPAAPISSIKAGISVV